jgi:hypothetical protein
MDVVTEALAGAAEAFHSSLVATLQDVRADAPEGGGVGDDGDNGLGRFASGRIDLDRFAAVIERGMEVCEQADPDGSLRRARETLTELESHVEDLLTVDVPAGASLRDTVAAALASLGRVFGAVRVVEHARSGLHGPEVSAADLMGLPFARWTHAERLRAPPLMVRVAGADLHADALNEFLDGCVRLVLVVSAPAPPAPLARLVTSGVFVLQTVDGDGLERLAAWDGPGIAAVLTEGAACFVHDPGGGPSWADRLHVQSLPDEAPGQPVGGMGPEQMARQLTHLVELRELGTAPATLPPDMAAPASTVSAPDSAPAAGPADRLAAWLLGQADLTD